MWLIAFGFGGPTPFVATHLLRTGSLPIFFGLFPAYGGGLFQRLPPDAFAICLGLFAAVCAIDAYAAVLLWNAERTGALLTLALLPIELVFWIGFALPIPPLFAVARVALLALGWSALR